VNATLWDGLKPRLDGRQVIAPNFPGFGGRPHGSASLEAFAQGVLREMDAAGMSTAIVAGVSMGGYVAFRLYELAPERVAALILADTRAGADTEAGAAKRTAQAERVRTEGTAWLADALIPDLLGETTRRERPLVVQSVRRMIEAASAEGVINALLAMRGRPDSTPLLPTIEVPVLALVGEEDTITPIAETRSIAEKVPDGRWVAIPRAGHLSVLENPKAFEDAFREFIG
jgi:pimeloyl-ACP methyl ester carboxylesterase